MITKSTIISTNRGALPLDVIIPASDKYKVGVRDLKVSLQFDDYRILGVIERGLLDVFDVKLENGYHVVCAKGQQFAGLAGWRELGFSLMTGDEVQLGNGLYSRVMRIDPLGKACVFDLEVENHIYSANGILTKDKE